MRARTFLINGLLAGVLAGLAAFAVAYVVGEPPVDAAIAVEEAGATDDGHGHTHGGADDSAADEVVSRGTQSTGGLLVGTLVAGTVLGGVVGLLAGLAVGRLGPLLPVAGTALVATLGFVSYALVPFLRYPPNPPAVGDEATIGVRTAAYFGLVAASVLLAVVATAVAVRLAQRYGGYRGVLAGLATYALPIAVLTALLPAAVQVSDFPAQVLWDFRVASLLTQTALWGVLGLALTGLVARTWSRHRAEVARREFAASL